MNVCWSTCRQLPRAHPSPIICGPTLRIMRCQIWQPLPFLKLQTLSPMFPNERQHGIRIRSIEWTFIVLLLSSRRQVSDYLSCLNLGSPKISPETKMLVQLVYLGSDPKRHKWGIGKWGREGRIAIREHINEQVTAEGNWVAIPLRDV